MQINEFHSEIRSYVVSDHQCWNEEMKALIVLRIKEKYKNQRTWIAIFEQISKIYFRKRNSFTFESLFFVHCFLLLLLLLLSITLTFLVWFFFYSSDVLKQLISLDLSKFVMQSWMKKISLFVLFWKCSSLFTQVKLIARRTMTTRLITSIWSIFKDWDLFFARLIL